MIANELVTNAIKHGRGEDGRVQLDIRTARRDGALVIGVRDHGSGVHDAWLESQTSLGSRILSALVQQVRGSLDVQNMDGAEFTLRVPLDAPPSSRPAPSA
jgi:two-component sensor histidine kinase